MNKLKSYIIKKLKECKKSLIAKEEKNASSVKYEKRLNPIIESYEE